MKHRVLRDYQFVDVSKKIFVLKANSVIEDYVAEIGSESIDIDRVIIDNNPDFFIGRYAKASANTAASRKIGLFAIPSKLPETHPFDKRPALS